MLPADEKKREFLNTDVFVGKLNVVGDEEGFTVRVFPLDPHCVQALSHILNTLVWDGRGYNTFSVIYHLCM
jgi:hypothetical protein